MQIPEPKCGKFLGYHIGTKGVFKVFLRALRGIDKADLESILKFMEREAPDSISVTVYSAADDEEPLFYGSRYMDVQKRWEYLFSGQEFRLYDRDFKCGDRVCLTGSEIVGYVFKMETYYDVMGGPSKRVEVEDASGLRTTFRGMFAANLCKYESETRGEK
jgi:hypothetical protein